jgi:hypothetical protein
MTILGKILVIINLVAALLVGGFLVVDYATRSNWSHVAEDAFQKVTAARANTSALEVETKDLKSNLDALRTERAQLRADLDQWKKKYRKDLRDEKDNTKKAEADATESAKVAKAAKEEAQRLTKEVKMHQKGVEERDKTIVKQVDEIRRLLGRAVTAETNVHTLQQRLETLVDTLEAKEKQLAKLRSGPARVAKRGKEGGGKNPPPAFVRGVVTGVIKNRGLIEISLGSDEGVEKDNTLEVYRLKPKPQYLGTLRILQSREHKAVGVMLKPEGGRRRCQVAKGDEVASTIMDR